MSNIAVLSSPEARSSLAKTVVWFSMTASRVMWSKPMYLGTKSFISASLARLTILQI